ncbi:MAG: universal stress protein, partial [Terriglobales bacterium]
SRPEPIVAHEIAAARWQEFCHWCTEMLRGMVVDFGDPAERILHAIHEHQADVLALGVRHAGEASTHFRNTVAYKVVQEAECPVLTQRTA